MSMRNTRSKFILAAMVIAGALTVSQVVNGATERVQASSTSCPGTELSGGQRLVMEIENEKARLGVRGFSPLRNFPVGEVQWSCWSTR